MENGLHTKDVIEKTKIFGKNELTGEKPISPLALFLSQFPSVINSILGIAGVLSLVIGDLLDGAFIFAILILNALFGFIQQYRAEKSLQKLKEYITPLSRVIRDGKEQNIYAKDLVPGDLVILSEGERVAADGKIVLSHGLEIDESLLTGESLPVGKSKDDFVFSGTLVIKGKGSVTVGAIGQKTKLGQIAHTLSSVKNDKTPLEERLDALGKTLSLSVVVIVALLITIGMLQGKPPFPLILLAVSIGIAAIPEGLPAVMTVALGIGVNRMAKRHAIVRKMAAIETLGTVQIILTDKTGTLTQNVMQVKKHWVKNPDGLPTLLEACILGNTASLVQKSSGSFDVIGEKTDGALLVFAQEKTGNIDKMKKNGTIIDEYTFDPVRKTVTTVWQQKDKTYVLVRGAPEEILDKSTLDTKRRNQVRSLYEEYAKEGLRVIGFGRKVKTHTDTTRSKLENKLEFIGIVGIYDPPRKEAKESIEKAKHAGIRPVMVTGDNELTALAIGKDIGLIEEDENVITGDAMSKLSDEEMLRVLEKTSIFARVRPEDKLRLVELFKQKGYVVGVTGDGVNDALALKRADIGIAMGQKGTDVAKEASDIILADDNFSTIVYAIEEGRTIYQNILKAITYLLSGNLAEISLVFFGSLLGLPAPLLPTQILWINLVTDGLPALALASDTRTHGVLNQKPRNHDTPILSQNRVLFALVIGLGLAFSLLFIFSLLLKTNTEIYARTVVFNLLIFSHMFIAYLVRGSSIFRFNKFLILSIICTAIAQFIITTVPFFQNIFHLSVF